MANARILVVEDEAIVAKDVRGRLEGLGYAVPAIASSGEQAVGRAAEGADRVMIVDQQAHPQEGTTCTDS